jgi:hypothetical protein
MIGNAARQNVMSKKGRRRTEYLDAPQRPKMRLDELRNERKGVLSASE